MYTITLPSFEGPLDLLLRLVERAELDITTIALAQVTDQYLAHVRALDMPDPRQLADFVALAARLILIKSRMLLPRPVVAAERNDGAAEIDDAELLAQQLREYRRYKQAAAWLRACQDEGRRTFLRTAALPVLVAAEPVNLDHTLAELIAAVQRRMQLLLPLDEATGLSLQPRLTVGDVIAQVNARLEVYRWFAFNDLLVLATTRQEVIVTFWAVLELLKQRKIVVEQTELFGLISIGRNA
jgi:segregation and condensation protein A